MSRLGEAYFMDGRLQEARAVAERTLAVTRERGNEAWVLRILGEITARGEPMNAEGAERSYGQALALASELGMRPRVAHCHFGLGTLYGTWARRDKPGPT